MPSASKTIEYKPLSGEDEDLDDGGRAESGKHPRSQLKGATVTFLGALLCVLAGFMGGALSFKRSASYSTDTRVQKTFTYHEQFTYPPSAQSNSAWFSLFPEAHGFVKPPGYSNLSLIAVFHQLHCINVLRHGYYVARNISYEEESLKDITISRESIKHEHVIHCFDYLRQAIECASDRTIEHVDVATGGTDGWGEAHSCNNHSKTLEFAKTWELRKDGGS